MLSPRVEFEIWFGQESDQLEISSDADTIAIPLVEESTVVVPLVSLDAVFKVDTFYVTTIVCLSKTIRQVYRFQSCAASLEDIAATNVDIANRRVVANLAEKLAERVYNTTKNFKIPLSFEYKNGGKVDGKKGLIRYSIMQEGYISVFRSVLEFQLRQKGLTVL